MYPYSGEYKNGVFGKKTETKLWLFGKYVEGVAAKYKDGKFVEYEFKAEYEKINEIKQVEVLGYKCLYFEYSKYTVCPEELYFPGIDKIDEIIQNIKENKCQVAEAKLLQEQQEKALEEQRIISEKQSQVFYKECYEFHIGIQDNPYYELQKGDLILVCIYLDKERNLNFLKIDGRTKEESNAVIAFNKIHYFEKAGSIHYTTTIDGNYSSFGGSVTGATISKAATLFGGLLMGPMGMAAGAVLSHKRQEVKIPEQSFGISSEVRQIDDRSVIINFYSDSKKQYMDIELPADIYNFLQTYLPEKKYGIVLELEKSIALKAQEKQVSLLQSEQKPVLEVEDDDMASFKRKMEKLKIMYDSGVLSEEEFEREKARILETL